MTEVDPCNSRGCECSGDTRVFPTWRRGRVLLQRRGRGARRRSAAGPRRWRRLGQPGLEIGTARRHLLRGRPAGHAGGQAGEGSRRRARLCVRRRRRCAARREAPRGWIPDRRARRDGVDDEVPVGGVGPGARSTSAGRSWPAGSTPGRSWSSRRGRTAPHRRVAERRLSSGGGPVRRWQTRVVRRRRVSRHRKPGGVGGCVPATAREGEGVDPRP